jgi:hypothetical protein
MISVFSEFKSGFVDVSFPNSKIVIQNILDFIENKYSVFHTNRPGLCYWVLVLVSNIDFSEFIRVTEVEYGVASYLRFCNYTIIPTRDQKILQRKIKYVGVYYRSHGNDNLFNLRWASSKIFANAFGEIVYLTSPIQLFGRYRNYSILHVWASGFRSSVANGCLEVRLSFHCFYLGKGYTQ